MKSQIKHCIVLVVALGATFRLFAQGYIVPNGVIGVAFDGADYIIGVIQNPTNSDYTGFKLEPQNANTFRFDPFADEGVRTFLVSSNTCISLQPILSHSFTELLFPNSYIFADGVPFYLGFYTGFTPVNGIYSYPVFGWGEFVNNGGAIQMLGSALEIQGAGIIAGTQTIVQPTPEPSTLALSVFGGLLLAWRLRKGHQTQ